MRVREKSTQTQRERRNNTRTTHRNTWVTPIQTKTRRNGDTCISRERRLSPGFTVSMCGHFGVPLERERLQCPSTPASLEVPLECDRCQEGLFCDQRELFVQCSIVDLELFMGKWRSRCASRRGLDAAKTLNQKLFEITHGNKTRRVATTTDVNVDVLLLTFEFVVKKGPFRFQLGLSGRQTKHPASVAYHLLRTPGQCPAASPAAVPPWPTQKRACWSELQSGGPETQEERVRERERYQANLPPYTRLTKSSMREVNLETTTFFAVVVQNLATQWIQSYPCKTKTSQ